MSKVRKKIKAFVLEEKSHSLVSREVKPLGVYCDPMRSCSTKRRTRTQPSNPTQDFVRLPIVISCISVRRRSSQLNHVQVARQEAVLQYATVRDVDALPLVRND